jgi:hypothetical protein
MMDIEFSEYNLDYLAAVGLIVISGKASTSFIQRTLKLGYNQAARLIEQMERDGIVAKANHVGKREVRATAARIRQLDAELAATLAANAATLAANAALVQRLDEARAIIEDMSSRGLATYLAARAFLAGGAA